MSKEFSPLIEYVFVGVMQLFDCNKKFQWMLKISKEEEMIVWNRVDKTFIWPSSRFLYLYFGTKCLLYQLTKGLNNINVVRDSQFADWIKKMLRLFMKSEQLLLCTKTYFHTTVCCSGLQKKFKSSNDISTNVYCSHSLKSCGL